MESSATDKPVQREIAALWSDERLILRETQSAVTPFGGIAVFLCPYAFAVWYVLLMAGGKEAAVFISYAHQDGAALATQLQRDLAKLGWDVWLDSARLTGGASWTVEIEQALDRSD